MKLARTWDKWLRSDRAALDALCRAVSRHVVEELFAESVDQPGLIDELVEDVCPSSVYMCTRLTTLGQQQGRLGLAPVSRGVWTPASGGRPVERWERSWQPSLRPLPPPPPPRPRHPIEGMAATPPLPGFMLHIGKGLAQHIAGYWAGRPAKEWSGLASVKMTSYQYRGEPSFRWRLCELFRHDDADARYDHRDSAGSTTIPHAWHAKLVDDLILAGRESEVALLRGHVHSHNSMGAFWSDTDEAMIGGLLSEQTALTTRERGWVLSVVVGAGLSLKARLDCWQRHVSEIAYTSYRDLPVYVHWPVHVLLSDLMSVRAERPAPPRYPHVGDWEYEQGMQWRMWDG